MEKNDSKIKKVNSKTKNKKKTSGRGLIIIIFVIFIIAIAIFSIKIANNVNKNNTETAEKNVINNIKSEYVEILSDGTEQCTSDKLNETKKVEDLEVKNIKLTSKDNITQITAVVTNTGSKDMSSTQITITVLDKSGNTIATIPAYIKALSSGESTALNASTTFNYANAYDIVIKK